MSLRFYFNNSELSLKEDEENADESQSESEPKESTLQDKISNSLLRNLKGELPGALGEKRRKRTKTQERIAKGENEEEGGLTEEADGEKEDKSSESPERPPQQPKKKKTADSLFSSFLDQDSDEEESSIFDESFFDNVVRLSLIKIILMISEIH